MCMGLAQRKGGKGMCSEKVVLLQKDFELLYVNFYQRESGQAYCP